MNPDVLKSKLNRPYVGREHTVRERLWHQLDGAATAPFVLVSAPAGFGKTTLVSSWLDTRGERFAWLSVDAGDDDLRTFLRYLLAAVRTVAPDTARRTGVLLQEPALPPVAELSAALSNDLDELEMPFHLALDDYHHIKASEVHELVSSLVMRPPRTLRLILLARHDPPLPLETLRAQNRIAEVRAQQLRFTREEAADMVATLSGTVPGDRALDNLEVQNDGWAVGLQLISLAARERKDVDAYLRDLQVGPRTTRDYLAREVLDAQPPQLQAWLLRISILDRFCAPLCETLKPTADGEPDDGSDFLALSGADFVAELEHRGLFVIALDDQNEWFRFHHVFRDLLSSELNGRESPGGVLDLHSSASAWFAEHDFVEEALDHACTAGDMDSATSIVAERRHVATGLEDWHRLNAWLERLPPADLEADPRLVLARAWFASFCAQFDLMIEYMVKASGFELDSRPDGPSLEGEIRALEASMYFIGLDAPGVIRSAERALELLPLDFECVRGYAIFLLSWGYSASGRGREAREALWREMDAGRNAGPAFRGRVRGGLAHVLLREGDLAGSLTAARQLFEIGEEHDLLETVIMARSFMAWAHYLRDELEEAEAHFKAILLTRRSAIHIGHVEGHIGLALCMQARGHYEKARQWAQEMTALGIARDQPMWIEEGRIYEAEIALRQGGVDEAKTLVEHHQALQPRWGFMYEPQLTRPRLWLAEGTPASLERAKAELAPIRERFEASNDRMRLAEVLAVEALVEDALGHAEIARDRLSMALPLTRQGGAIRPYLDRGPSMASLLRKVELPPEESEQVDRILQALGSTTATERSTLQTERPSGEELVEPLTNRELDVLELLDERFRDKEIAERLSIAPGTVRSHLKSAYRKLDVNGRRSAVERARELGILKKN